MNAAFIAIGCLLLSQAEAFAAPDRPLSPFNPEGEVDSIAETSRHIYLVELDVRALVQAGQSNDSAAYDRIHNLYRIDKTDPTKVEKVPNVAREMYMDGGSRVVRFQLGGEEGILYIPMQPGETDVAGIGTQPAVRVGKNTEALTFSSFFPLEETAKSRLSRLYDPVTRLEFERTGGLPLIDVEKTQKTILSAGKRNNPLGCVANRFLAIFRRR